MTARPNPIDTGKETRTTRVGSAGRALTRVMQATGHNIHPNDAGRVLNNMVEAMIAARTIDTVEKELSTVQTMIKGATILAAVEVLTLWETDLRREYTALKDADELCMTIGCREHSGPENPYCDGHGTV